MTYAEWVMTGAPYCHGQVARAIRQGVLRHPKRVGMACTDCLKPAVEYDHRDYNRPLDVAPVCRSCNLRRGRAVPRLWSNVDEFTRHFKCRQRVVPWAVEYCLDRIEFIVSNIERATGGKVTRHELRPDIYGPAPGIDPPIPATEAAGETRA